MHFKLPTHWKANKNSFHFSEGRTYKWLINHQIAATDNCLLHGVMAKAIKLQFLLTTMNWAEFFLLNWTRVWQCKKWRRAMLPSFYWSSSSEKFRSKNLILLHNNLTVYFIRIPGSSFPALRHHLKNRSIGQEKPREIPCHGKWRNCKQKSKAKQLPFTSLVELRSKMSQQHLNSNTKTSLNASCTTNISKLLTSNYWSRILGLQS